MLPQSCAPLLVALLAFSIPSADAAQTGTDSATAERGFAGHEQWWHHLSDGPQPREATMTFGPITATYENASTNGLGSGGNIYMTWGITGASTSSLGEHIRIMADRVIVTYKGRSFTVMKPGDRLIVGRKTYHLDNDQRAAIRFGRNGTTTVTLTPAPGQKPDAAGATAQR